jgi:uncharacterized membrane protein
MVILNRLKILNRIKEASTFGLSVIYTIGHICIAMLCTYFITGAPLNLAAADAIIEPVINGFWFALLHGAWSKEKATT